MEHSVPRVLGAKRPRPSKQQRLQNRLHDRSAFVPLSATPMKRIGELRTNGPRVNHIVRFPSTEMIDPFSGRLNQQAASAFSTARPIPLAAPTAPVASAAERDGPGGEEQPQTRVAGDGIHEEVPDITKKVRISKKKREQLKKLKAIELRTGDLCQSETVQRTRAPPSPRKPMQQQQEQQQQKQQQQQHYSSSSQSPSQLQPKQQREHTEDEAKAHLCATEDNRTSESALFPLEYRSNGALTNDPSAQYLHAPTNTPLVKAAREYFKTEGVKEFKVNIGPLKGWRSHAKLAVRAGHPSDAHLTSSSVSPSPSSEWVLPVIGLFSPGTHEVVHLPTCTAHHPSINLATAVIQRACQLFAVSGFNEETEEGDLRYIVMNVQSHSLQVQCTLVWNIPAPGRETAPPLKRQKTNAGVCHFPKAEAETPEKKWTRMCAWLAEQRMETCDMEAIAAALSTEKDAAMKRVKKQNKVVKRSGGDSPGHGVAGDSTDRRRLFHSIWIHRRTGKESAIFARDHAAWQRMHGPDVVLECIYPNVNGMVFAAAAAALVPSAQTKENPFDPIQSSTLTAISTACTLPYHNPTKPFLLFPPNVFRQANLAGFGCIVQAIRAWIPKDSRVVELYGGVGTIGLNIADLARYVFCSDENPYNQNCFERARHLLPEKMRKRLSYETIGAAQAALAGYLRSGLNNQGVDVVVVDPPRKGLDDEVRTALNSDYAEGGGPMRLIYVSCGFKALKRDLEHLVGTARKERPWSIVHAEGHVLFPGADHLETMVVLDRKKQ